LSTHALRRWRYNCKQESDVAHNPEQREEDIVKECPPNQVQTAREIIDYLARQPSEEDTLEGIVRHRMPEGATSKQTTLVKEVIGDLVVQGLLEKITKEGRTVYRVKSRL
jgi:hypothetical protein